MSELAEPFHMALPSFSQHLDVLEDCGLVRSRKEGRVRTYQLAPQQLKAAEGWLARQRTLEEHTANRRVEELERALDEAVSGDPERAHTGMVVAGAG